MKRAGRKVLSGSARALLAAGVVACLCFSAGEGLRLTPLPFAPHAEAAAPNLDAEVGLSCASWLNRVGPLDVPAQGQLQKRGKRHAPECECPPAARADAAPPRQPGRQSHGRPSPSFARPADARPPGRAPPFHA